MCFRKQGLLMLRVPRCVDYVHVIIISEQGYGDLPLNGENRSNLPQAYLFGSWAVYLHINLSLMGVFCKGEVFQGEDML